MKNQSNNHATSVHDINNRQFRLGLFGTGKKRELTPAQQAEKQRLLNDPKGGYFKNLKKQG